MKKWFLAWLGVLTLTAGLTWAPPRVAACSCAEPPPLTEDLERQTAVFAGKVVDIVEPSGDLIRSSADPMQVVFEVNASWKGVRTKQAVVQTEISGASCGYENFEVGREYVVFATGPLEQLKTGLCTRTAPLESSAALTAELGPSVAPVEVATDFVRQPPAEVDGGAGAISRTGVAYILGGFLLLAAILFIVSWRMAGRKR